MGSRFANTRHWVSAALVAALLGTSCARPLSYVETAVSDRRANMLGVETLFLQHLEQRPEEFSIFLRIVIDADNALHSHRLLTRATVARWIDRRANQEGFGERTLPGLFFLRTVYLAGWHHGYLHLLSDDDRELLSDLISAVMGALHKCRTCTTAHPPTR